MPLGFRWHRFKNMLDLIKQSAHKMSSFCQCTESCSNVPSVKITIIWSTLAAMPLGAKSYTAMHYNKVIMGALASQIASLARVYLAVKLGANQIKHQSSASLAFVRGIHRRPVNSPHKRPATRKMFPFDDVIMGITKFVARILYRHLRHILFRLVMR